MDNQELVSPGGFAQLLGISRWTFLKWRQGGILPQPLISRGRIHRWTSASIEQFINQGVKA